jgi:hypothetical protein
VVGGYYYPGLDGGGTEPGAGPLAVQEENMQQILTHTSSPLLITYDQKLSSDRSFERTCLTKFALLLL